MNTRREFIHATGLTCIPAFCSIAKLAFPLLAGIFILLPPVSGWAQSASAEASPQAATPPVASAPRINGAKIFGARPGSPFLFTIAATGQRPLNFTADGLPEGLKLDSATGQITGMLRERGEHAITLHATNAQGSAARKLRIVIGDHIALTPPMGWNSWNCWGGEITQEKVLNSARALVEKGLRDHGWTYINIDDGWQGVRGGEFNAIQPNSKFPDMKALGTEVHALGLKFGIYSTPWRGSYEGHIGSTGDDEKGSVPWITSGEHNEFYRIGKTPEANKTERGKHLRFGKVSFAVEDAKQWAAWGVDYMKYDWHPNDVPHVEEMSRALRQSGRDVVFSLSNTATYNSAADFARLATAWRTTSDIVDTWDSMSRIGFSQDRWAAYTGPGHWSDPDMLVVGHVGWGSNLHLTRLTRDEQYTHISLWCLLSAPLLIGCDIAQMDDFTLGLLTNDEVLDINQDPLGKAATQISNEGNEVIYAKPLEDGSMAIGLFNRGPAETTMRLINWSFASTGWVKGYTIRDLWQRKDLGKFDGRLEVKVPAHGVVLLRFSPPAPPTKG